jgi:uncharacterized ion transporter superfamily protein YfcC
MLLSHVAGILLFSGPVFYIGLWMVLDPAGIAWLPEFGVRVFRNLVRSLGGRPAEEIAESEQTAISRRVRTHLRLTGVALLLIAIVV